VGTRTIVPQGDIYLTPISLPRWHHGHVRPSRDHGDRPILITEAPVNADDEFDHRRKRYLLMMALRAVCIVGAASTFSLSGWLAAGFVAAALVLPWSAVLIANDRPPKQELRFRRFVGVDKLAQRQLTSGDPQPPAADARPPAEPRIIDI
jgi:Protein of unknown function (DUF3099)